MCNFIMLNICEPLIPLWYVFRRKQKNRFHCCCVPGSVQYCHQTHKQVCTCFVNKECTAVFAETWRQWRSKLCHTTKTEPEHSCSSCWLVWWHYDNDAVSSCIFVDIYYCVTTRARHGTTWSGDRAWRNWTCNAENEPLCRLAVLHGGILLLCTTSSLAV